MLLVLVYVLTYAHLCSTYLITVKNLYLLLCYIVTVQLHVFI